MVPTLVVDDYLAETSCDPERLHLLLHLMEYDVPGAKGLASMSLGDVPPYKRAKLTDASHSDTA